MIGVIAAVLNVLAAVLYAWSYAFRTHGGRYEMYDLAKCAMHVMLAAWCETWIG